MRTKSRPAWTFCLAAAAVGLISVPAVAGPLADAATRAEGLAAAGDAAGARAAIRNGMSDFLSGLPFAVGTATFVTADPSGFGLFDPRPNSVFRPGEKMVAYVEPLGLTWKPASAPGRFESRFSVDFDLLDDKGAVLASQKSFGNFAFTAATKTAGVFATLTVDVSNATVGSYVLRYHLNDSNSGKAAVVDLPFSIKAAQ
ncbi:hypothetical protein ASG25_00155 [Rhizobium sp. Leaf384]|nr:hypothetical protein ASG58_15350 [Rhizobium sp. Leaf383]KQS80115.1 hypothetical protein ASG25_00155 [Rhizobium sp. Leaf384]